MLLTRKRLRRAVIIFLTIYTSGLPADEFSQAEEYLNQGKLNKANWIYYSSLNNNVRTDEAHMGLAKSMIQAGKYDAALQHINMYLETNTNSNEALKLRSQIFVLTQQWASAVADIKRTVPTDDADMYMLLNIAYQKLDQPELAKQAKDEFDRIQTGKLHK